MHVSSDTSQQAGMSGLAAGLTGVTVLLFSASRPVSSKSWEG